MTIAFKNVISFLKDGVKVVFGKFIPGDSGTNTGGKLPFPQGTYDGDTVGAGQILVEIIHE